VQRPPSPCSCAWPCPRAYGGIGEQGLLAGILGLPTSTEQYEAFRKTWHLGARADGERYAVFTDGDQVRMVLAIDRIEDSDHRDRTCR
jgi:hypothetical protein